MMHERICFGCGKKQTISVEELFREAVSIGLAKRRNERINELFWHAVDNKEMCPECFNIKDYRMRKERICNFCNRKATVKVVNNFDSIKVPSGWNAVIIRENIYSDTYNTIKYICNICLTIKNIIT